MAAVFDVDCFLFDVSAGKILILFFLMRVRLWRFVGCLKIFDLDANHSILGFA